MQATSDPQAAVVEAFYARVMHRVCSSYLVESELPADAAVARLQQKWKQKLALYTGKREQSDAMAEDVETSQVEAAQSPTESEASDEDEDDDASSVSSSSSSSSASSSASSFASQAAPQQAVGRPSAQLPSAAPSTTSSIFTKMLGGKRKLHQLDGSASDDDDAVEWQDDKLQQDPHDEDTTSVGRLPSVVHVQASNIDEEGSSHNEAGEVESTVRPATREEEEEDAEEEEKGEDVQQDEELPSSPADSTASTSALVSADDVAPVSGLSGIDLPLQLAAEYTKFGHRGVRRGYVGDLRAIVLTWPSRLSASESVLPGDLVWCYGEHRLEGHVGLVKVVSLGDTLDELKVEDARGAVTTVQMHQVRRLKEYLIRKGTVQLRGIR